MKVRNHRGQARLTNSAGTTLADLPAPDMLEMLSFIDCCAIRTNRQSPCRASLRSPVSVTGVAAKSASIPRCGRCPASKRIIGIAARVRAAG